MARSKRKNGTPDEEMFVTKKLGSRTQSKTAAKGKQTTTRINSNKPSMVEHIGLRVRHSGVFLRCECQESAIEPTSRPGRNQDSAYRTTTALRQRSSSCLTHMQHGMENPTTRQTAKTPPTMIQTNWLKVNTDTGLAGACRVVEATVVARSRTSTSIRDIFFLFKGTEIKAKGWPHLK